MRKAAGRPGRSSGRSGISLAPPGLRVAGRSRPGHSRQGPKWVVAGLLASDCWLHRAAVVHRIRQAIPDQICMPDHRSRISLVPSSDQRVRLRFGSCRPLSPPCPTRVRLRSSRSTAVRTRSARVSPASKTASIRSKVPARNLATIFSMKCRRLCHVMQYEGYLLLTQ